ncbi:g8621 [Coccomyxa viridis]|uniref:G8621 protein n=1 Tax=Coccomyxa viridis TaxID=1274662 RepID=A0ABP1G0X6_9CHLO
MLVATSLSQVHSRCTQKHVSPVWHFETAENPYDSASDSNSDCEDQYLLPELPGIYLAEIGPSRSPTARYDLCGSAMDVSTTPIGIGNILGWDKSTAEIAFYERPDPGTRKLVLVGAYPVIGGFAQLNLDQLAGKGKTSSNPMYIVPGGGLTLLKLLRLSWPHTRELPG